MSYANATDPPGGIAVGPDGNLWITATGHGTLLIKSDNHNSIIELRP